MRTEDGYPNAGVAVLALAAAAAVWLVAGALGFERIELAALCLLPAALAHAALTVPECSGLARLAPGLVPAGYVLAAVPAALGARAAPRQQGLAEAVESLAVALACGMGLALAVRLARALAVSTATSGTRSASLVAAIVALLGLGAGVVSEAGAKVAMVGGAALPVLLWIAARGAGEGTSASSPGAAAAAGGLSLEQVARGMAHTTIKPVTAVAQRLRVLSDATSDAAMRAELGEAAELMEQVRRLVRDVLDLAHAQAGPKRRRLNLARVVEQAVADVRLRFPRVPFEVEAPDLLVPVDETALRTMLVNVLENAAEAGAKPRAVRVELASDGAGGARLRVLDRGEGIPPGLLGRLFEPFETSKPRGTGLGLTVAREICRAHGGELTLDAAVGETVLEAHLPAVER